MVGRCFVFAVALLLSIRATAQVEPSAYGGPPILTVGGTYSFFDADYAGNHLAGPGTYLDWSPLGWRGFGVEGEGRWLTFDGSNNLKEHIYLAGPWYRFPVIHRLRPYAKLLGGEGEIDFPYHLARGSYFALAPGGGVDFFPNRRWRFRADYEYQFWLNSPGIPGEQGSAIKPNGLSLGMSYKLF
jgi:opacity protein-like surface antigen